MAKVSFLSGLDKARSIISAIAKAVTDAGGNAEELLSSLDTGTPAATNKLKRIAAVLMEKSEVGIIDQLVAIAKFKAYNKNINDTNFRATAMPSIEGARLEHYGKTMPSHAVLADLEAKGRRAATAAEILLWAATHPKDQGQFYIVALGQYMVMVEGFDEITCFVGIYGDADNHIAVLFHIVDDFAASNQFLSLPL